MSKSNKLATAGIVGIFLLLAGTAGYITDGFGLFASDEPEITETKIIEQTKEGKVATFKLSVKDNGDSPARFAGTGYCYDNSKPNALIGGGSVTLSATAGTTVSPTTVGQTITCVAFDSTHYGVPKTMTIGTESEQMILSALNASAQSDMTFAFYENGAVESGTASIDMSASATDTFDKIEIKANVGDKGFNFKTFCLGSNATSSSEINNIEIDGMTKTAVPYAYRNSHDYCYSLPSAQYIEDFAELTTGKIKISLTSSFSDDEMVNVTILDEAYYESADGSIKIGIETDADTPSSTGASDISTEFAIV